ncbi:MAG: TrbC/VirB2 family protein [Candidatus Pacebacteria bacterium]|nr:TrbC/VirB2 family protein [Candidatus Paceibacterota bacterium]
MYSMKKIVKILTLGLFVFGALFFRDAKAETCVLKTAQWDKSSAASREAVGITITGTGCAGWTVALKIYDPYNFWPDNEVGNGTAVFGSDDKARSGWTVDPWQRDPISGSRFYIIAQAGAGAGSTIDSRGNSMGILNVSASGTGNGNPTITFDLNPKQIATAKIDLVTYSFKLHLDKPDDFFVTCTGRGSQGSSWQVKRKIGGDTTSVVRNVPFRAESGKTDYSFDFAENYNFGVDNSSYSFVGQIFCGGRKILESAAVTVKVGTPASNCGGAGQPACSVDATAPKSYSFTITNPLAGGPNDLFDIINIVTQWIIYISVPMAVLWIMWAGFLMLTAGGTPANFNKGKDILKYVVIGLAIIFIGKGFVSLIISIIELSGSTPTTQTQDGGTGALGGPKSMGWTCSSNSDCNSGLKCQNTMCTSVNGNIAGEPCLDSQCAQGLACDNSGSAQKIIAGRKVGSCYQALCQPKDPYLFSRPDEYQSVCVDKTGTSTHSCEKTCVSGSKKDSTCYSSLDCQ